MCPARPSSSYRTTSWLRKPVLEQYLAGVFHMFGYSWSRYRDGNGRLKKCAGCSYMHLVLCGDDGKRHGVLHEPDSRHAPCVLCVKPSPSKVVKPVILNQPGSLESASSTSNAQKVVTSPNKVGDARWFRELMEVLQGDEAD